ncbi:MAG: hypothetical protein QOJ65_1887 [Fimbriimonadaceae bacterium]|jgi:phage tail tape-measure protein|nr:hypothetical protein [Fimbriimonadaceae bacterium]
MADKHYKDDNIQHGIDDNPKGDAKKGAALGGAGGAITGAVAGAPLGPGGMAVGAVVGGLVGAGASGAAVAGVDKIDNDNNVTGVGDKIAYDKDSDNTYVSTNETYVDTDNDGEYRRVETTEVRNDD